MNVWKMNAHLIAIKEFVIFVILVSLIETIFNLKKLFVSTKTKAILNEFSHREFIISTRSLSILCDQAIRSLSSGLKRNANKTWNGVESKETSLLIFLRKFLPYLLNNKQTIA